MAVATRIPAEALSSLAVDVLAAAGVPATDAALAARSLVDAELMGVTTHGVMRLVSYTDRIRAGGVAADASVKIDRKAPSLALVDGHNGLGPVVAGHAALAAIAVARETGIAYVGCRASNHLGALAPYALWACEAGLVSIAASNSSPMMPPAGGREARVGNNPLAVGAPVADGRHFILDMAMSVAARAKIRSAIAAGEPIPEGWAADSEGRPTTDPVAAMAGLILPMAGHKGSGLAQAVDILTSVLTGARFLTGVTSWIDAPERPSDLGHFFLMIDPDRLIGRDAFDKAMAEFRETIVSTPPAPGVPSVRMPGERMLGLRAKALAEGAMVDADVLRRLERLAGRAA